MKNSNVIKFPSKDYRKNGKEDSHSSLGYVRHVEVKRAMARVKKEHRAHEPSPLLKEYMERERADAK